MSAWWRECSPIWRRLKWTRFRVMFDPPGEEKQVRLWLAPLVGNVSAAVHFFPQSPGDLGERLSAGFGQAFEAGLDAVAAIGTDCVAITTEILSRTWSALRDDADAVFGPTEDGGYYLVAMNQFRPELFRSNSLERRRYPGMFPAAGRGEWSACTDPGHLCRR